MKDKINDLLKTISIEKIFVLKNCLPENFACIEKLLAFKSYFKLEKKKFIYIEFACLFFLTC
jgi:hypothetical protein